MHPESTSTDPSLAGVRYERHAPSPQLAGLVEHYWSVISPAPPEPLRAVLVPSGRATIQFCLGNPGRRFATGIPATRNADVFLPVGTRPLVIEQEGTSHYVGIQFKPWGARALVPDAPDTPTQVAEMLGSLPDVTALLSRPAEELDRWLETFLPADVDPREAELLAAVTALVDADPSGVQVHRLHAPVNVSASTMYRAFRRRIGLTPKQYIQVMRYRTFTDALLRDADGDPAALLAALAGYADQPHASREFSRFTGMTATAFRDTYDGIARLMARPD